HSGEVAEVIQMHQELDAHGLPCIRRHVHIRVEPRVPIQTLMEDRLQDGAGGIGDVSILPVEGNVVGGAVPVPEAQRACTSRHRELLIEGTVSGVLDSLETAKAIHRVSHECRKSPAVCKGVGYHGHVVHVKNYPVCEVPSLESFV